jgi:hypothetical protein
MIRFRKTSFGWSARIYMPTYVEYTCFYDEKFCEPGQPIEKFVFRWPYRPQPVRKDTYEFPV